jgi:hypothetical protein
MLLDEFIKIREWWVVLFALAKFHQESIVQVCLWWPFRKIPEFWNKYCQIINSNKWAVARFRSWTAVGFARMCDWDGVIMMSLRQYWQTNGSVLDLVATIWSRHSRLIAFVFSDPIGIRKKNRSTLIHLLPLWMWHPLLSRHDRHCTKASCCLLRERIQWELAS